MPQDGSNNYQYPPGTPGIPDQTIESEAYNTFLDDLVINDLNIPRPIHRGGTGADNAFQAMTNLGGEIAGIAVTNYDSHVWRSGSFYSATSATGAPVSGHAFTGVSYSSDPLTEPPANLNVIVEARDQSDSVVVGRLWVREKKAGVWSAWIEQVGGAEEVVAALDTRYVNVTGDTMTGILILPAIPPTLPEHVVSKQYVDDADAALDAAIDTKLPIAGGTITGDLNIDGALSADTTLTVTGVTTLDDLTCVDITSSGAGSFATTLDVTGITTLDDDLICVDVTSSGAGSFATTLAVTGATTLAAVTASGVGTFASIVSSGNILGGSLNITAGIIAGTQISTSTDMYASGNMTCTNFYCASPGNHWTNSSGGSLTVSYEGYKPGGGSWASSSDARIKAIQGDYTHGLAEIKQLLPRRYKFKGNDLTLGTGGVSARNAKASDPGVSSNAAVLNKEFVGLVAQECEAIMPEMVTLTTGSIDGQPVDDMRLLNASALTYALVNACKELAARVEALEAAG